MHDPFSNREMLTQTGGDKTPQRLRLSLRAWQRLLSRIDGNARIAWQTRFGYWLSGASHPLLARVQHASHADKIRIASPSPPLFILGFWRSGTTFLHELFCCDLQFGFASTYACMNPSHFLLTEQWVRQRTPQQARRPMDSMRYSWISPQEDEFALLAFGAPSAYEALIVPSLMRDARALLDIRQLPPDELNRWGKVLEYFIRLLTVQQGKKVVLKSPSHGFKLPILSTFFPLARYVIIERNPYEVFASNVRLWNTLVDMYGIESISSEEIEAFVLGAYVLHEEAIAEGVRRIDRRLIARVRYEQLVADPVECMAQLYEELELGDFGAMRSRLQKYLTSVADHTRNSFHLSPDQRQRVDSIWGELIDTKGYGWPRDRVAVG
jgi:hypothetical protein